VWKDLAGKLAPLMQPLRVRGELRTTRQLRFAEWASEQAGLLAAPESGLPYESAQALLDCLRQAVGSEWRSVAARLREGRRARARFVLNIAKKRRPDLKLDETGLLDRIDQDCGASPWREFVGGDGTARRRMSQKAKPVRKA
jgi:hypothetical protein